MAALLPLQSSLLLINNHRRFLHPPPISASPAKSKPTPVFAPATPQDTSNSSLNEGPPPPGEPTSAQAEKPTSSGQGFGRPAPPPKANTQKAGRRVVRRAPVVERAQSFVDKKDGVKEEPPVNESAFLLTWLGLGVVILIQGLLLASSGFLPEQYDNFLVKYLYPSFTPTVALFIAGTVSYGVFKYFQNENAKTSSK